MGGLAFPTKGSSSPPATTQYFGAIPDQFTMLSATSPSGALSLAPAKNVNQWAIINPDAWLGSGPNQASCSLGAMTTAPDGTNTAQHITEAAITSVHGMIARSPVGIEDQGGGTYRIGVFAKAAERTRIQLRLGQYGQFAGNECVTVFDLAGGQIGVANTNVNVTSNTNMIPGLASIIPYGNGWYRCEMDATFGYSSANNYNPSTGISAVMYLDAGSGTGVTDVTYAGDGSSGVYVWDSSMLPSRCWAMSGQVTFFDDFTSLNTIDINNTLEPGFNWYTNNIWTGFIGWRTTDGVFSSPSDLFSITGGTNLTMTPFAEQTALQSTLQTAGQNAEGSFVGGGPKIGAGLLLEFKYSFNANASGGWGSAAASNPLMWMVGLKAQYLSNTQANIPFTEFDLSGGTGMAFPSGGNIFFWQNGSALGTLTEGPSTNLQMGGWVGYPEFANNFPQYRSDQNIYGWVGSTIYKCTAASFLTPPVTSPPSDLSDWEVYTNSLTDPTDQLTDFTAQHTNTIIILPWVPGPLGLGGDIAYILAFQDGALSNGAPGMNNPKPARLLAPVPIGNSVAWPTTWTIDQYNVILHAGTNVGVVMDYVKFAQ